VILYFLSPEPAFGDLAASPFVPSVAPACNAAGAVASWSARF
jgi:hypothetical protein